ncbi:Histone deacetylase 1, partial [Trichinella sp. T8]
LLQLVLVVFNSSFEVSIYLGCRHFFIESFHGYHQYYVYSVKRRNTVCSQHARYVRTGKTANVEFPKIFAASIHTCVLTCKLSRSEWTVRCIFFEKHCDYSIYFLHYVFTQILRYSHAMLDCASMKAEILRFQTPEWTNSLVQSYGLTQCMKVMKTEWASEDDLKVFHTNEYIEAIKVATKTKSKKRGGDADCPEFFGVLEYCCAVAGSSLSSARVMNARTSDIIINWNGGMHHAKSYEASGFCFINDIVLAILELLKVYDRVLYVDIDCHHGDGVEEAFYTTNRVMTVSFHKYGDFFPGSGRLEDIGLDEGEKYAVNVPLNSGIGDANYVALFRMIITKIVEHFRPSAIVMQCGADSLAHDRLGCFNLSVSGHGECVKFVRSLQIPLMLLGGGGYSLHNVARCWTYETSIALDVPISNDLPFHEYYNFYSPSFKLHLPSAKNVLDMNGTRYLEYIRKCICENIHDKNSESSNPRKDSEDNKSGNPPEDSELLEIFEENEWLPGIDGIVHLK